MLSREYGGAQKNEQGNIAHRLAFVFNRLWQPNMQCVFFAALAMKQ